MDVLEEQLSRHVLLLMSIQQVNVGLLFYYSEVTLIFIFGFIFHLQLIVVC